MLGITRKKESRSHMEMGSEIRLLGR